MKYTPAHSLPLIEPATDLIRSASGDNLWKQLNAAMTAVDAALTKELASTIRFRGPLPSGADLNTYQGEAYAGIWSAPTSGIVASLLNAPPGLNPFTIEVQRDQVAHPGYARLPGGIGEQRGNVPVARISVNHLLSLVQVVPNFDHASGGLVDRAHPPQRKADAQPVSKPEFRLSGFIGVLPCVDALHETP